MTQTTVSNFFDGYARDFDAIYGTRNTWLNRLINNHLRKSMRLRFEKTITGCDPIEGKSVIDVGCGPGHFGVTLAQSGARDVLGVDFAQGMIDLAKQHAAATGVGDRCRFEYCDFLKQPMNEKFNYAIVMGFMDYMARPAEVIDKVLSITTDKAFFSFPVAGGVLAWQRKRRYRRRCDLFLYTRNTVKHLFEESGRNGVRFEIESISRDLFVTIHMA